MVVGLIHPWEVKLEIVGVGYQAALKNGVISLQVGFANNVELKVPEGVSCELPDNTHVVIKSADKHAAGQFAANIRAVRPPEPYKGKGIRYAGERVRRKAGKAFGS
jgi:large subunit ribosomal protein L6